MSTFNWNDLQAAAAEAGFSLVAAGVYDVEVISAKTGKTSGQKDKVVCRFKIEGGPENGSTFSDDFVISPDSAAAMGFFFRKMNAFGLDGKYFAALGQRYPTFSASLAGLCADLTGRKARAEVEIDYSYFEDGKNRIKKLSKLGAAPAPAAPGGIVRSNADTPYEGNDIFAQPGPADAALPAAPSTPPPPPAF